MARVVDEAPLLTQSTRARLLARLRGTGEPDRFFESLRATIRRVAR